MLLNLVTVSFQLAWRHIGPATAPLLTGDGAPLAGDGISPADVGATLVRVSASLTSNNSLLLVAGAPLVCNGAHPPGFRARRTSVSAPLARYNASVACDHFLQLKAAFHLHLMMAPFRTNDSDLIDC